MYISGVDNEGLCAYIMHIAPFHYRPSNFLFLGGNGIARLLCVLVFASHNCLVFIF